MDETFKTSPCRRHRNDVEAGDVHREEEEEEEASSSPFDIYRTKDASLQRLRRWRQSTLVLNACHRFRYTLDLKREEEKTETMRTIRVHAQNAALRFKEAGLQVEVSGTPKLPTTPAGDYGIDQERLASVASDHDFSVLEQYGGVKGLADVLKTNVEKGIDGDDSDLLKRMNAFGSNTYPRKKGPTFLRLGWEAWQDATLIVLIVAAAASLGLGIKSEVSTKWSH